MRQGTENRLVTDVYIQKQLLRRKIFGRVQDEGISLVGVSIKVSYFADVHNGFI